MVLSPDWHTSSPVRELVWLYKVAVVTGGCDFLMIHLTKIRAAFKLLLDIPLDKADDYISTQTFSPILSS